MKKAALGVLSAALLTSVAGLSHANGFVKLVGNAYVMDNNPDGNRMVVYGRYSNGALLNFGSVRTGGLGAGDNAAADPLGGQDSVILSEDGRFLYSVNAGSDDISVFFLTRRGRPVLIQTISSNGDFPVSMTLDDDVLYVLNAGSNGSIAGYNVAKNGRLSPIEGSVRSLNTGQEGEPEGDARNIAPGDIAFDTLNRRLLIPFGRGTEVGEGRLLTFSVDDNNLPSETFVETEAQGRLPFSVDFTSNGTALIAEALGTVGGDPVSGSLSSHNFADGANLLPVDSVDNGQVATCWVRVTHTTDIAFTSNTVADTLTSYSISRNGEITVLEGAAAADVGSPIDFALTKDDRYMYVTTSDDGGVRGYAVNAQTGQLRELGLFSGLPTFEEDGFAPQGMAVR